MNQLVDHLPNKDKTLNSNPSIVKKWRVDKYDMLSMKNFSTGF
jgi:hypothetical protein